MSELCSIGDIASGRCSSGAHVQYISGGAVGDVSCLARPLFHPGRRARVFGVHVAEGFATRHTETQTHHLGESGPLHGTHTDHTHYIIAFGSFFTSSSSSFLLLLSSSSSLLLSLFYISLFHFSSFFLRLLVSSLLVFFGLILLEIFLYFFYVEYSYLFFPNLNQFLYLNTQNLK